MKTIKFNNITYEEVLDFDSEKGDCFYATLIKGQNTVEGIANNVEGCEDIVVTEYNDNNEVISIKHYSNYTYFEGATLRKDFIIGVVDPDEEGAGDPIYADVVEIVLKRSTDFSYYLSQTKTLSTQYDTEFTFIDNRISPKSGQIFVQSSIVGLEPESFEIREGYATVIYPIYEAAIDMTCTIYSK